MSSLSCLPLKSQRKDLLFIMWKFLETYFSNWRKITQQRHSIFSRALDFVQVCVYFAHLSWPLTTTFVYLHVSQLNKVKYKFLLTTNLRLLSYSKVINIAARWLKFKIRVFAFNVSSFCKTYHARNVFVIVWCFSRNVGGQNWTGESDKPAAAKKWLGRQNLGRTFVC